MAKRMAELPLHYGKAPKWLFTRMVALSECIIDIAIDDYGTKGLLTRLSDPWFFQSLSCVLGFDWHSSGTTTVTCGALKEAMDPEKHGLAVAGGKGRASNRTPVQIEENAKAFGLTTQKTERLVYSSRMAAKVDNALVQDGFPIYQHCFFFDRDGDWIVIQQGISAEERLARRYHWPLEHSDFVEEPQNAILCDTKRSLVLDMTSKKGRESRKASVDLARMRPETLRRTFNQVKPGYQRSLDQWTAENALKTHLSNDLLRMPRDLNWEVMKKVYDFQPKDYEELVSFRNVGPATIRGLALVAELLYGAEPSWKDPVRYTFAFGGKDGVPFPVDRRAMDEATSLLRSGIEEAKVGREEKLRAVERLRRCIPSFLRDES